MAKINRDEFGHVILQGARTFGTVTANPSYSSRKQPRYHRMRERAANYFARVTDNNMRYTPRPMDEDQLKALQEHNEFARLPYEVKLHFYYNKYEELKKELDHLKKCGNKRKIDFLQPAIELEISVLKNQIVGIYEEFENEQ